MIAAGQTRYVAESRSDQLKVRCNMTRGRIFMIQNCAGVSGMCTCQAFLEEASELKDCASSAILRLESTSGNSLHGT